MRLLYLSTWDFSHEEADGVCKKIYSQITVFEKNGYDVDLIYIKNGEVRYRERSEERVIGKVGAIRKTPAYIKMYKHIKNKKYDWVYNRYGMMDTFYYRVLKRFHQNGARILIEIPTYPYTGEIPPGLLYKVMVKWDEIYIGRLKKIVNKIVTYSQDEVIYDIPTIQIRNGIDLSNVKTVSEDIHQDGIINLLIVALMQPYHGYERLLYGLKQYYDGGGTRDIVCHFVGDGPEKETYEKIVLENHLEKYVVFYGRQSGQNLDRIYNIADIGVCTLGGYKKGVYWSSELKSREYLAKGIPIIVGIDIDILEFIDADYYLQFPNDETIINIKKVVEFYDKICQKNRAALVKELRNIAETNISIDAVMMPICTYMREIMEDKK